MTVNIKILNEEFVEKYEGFLRKSPKSLLFFSNKYRYLLRNFLQAEDYYFIALNSENDVVGALPTFIKRNKEIGNIMNSLPFYGSNGGVIEFENNIEIRSALLNEACYFSQQESCLAATFIGSPFETDLSVYEEKTYTFRDQRIGQLTSLPTFNEASDDMLMTMYHQKTRNMIRKAMKSGITVHTDFSEENLQFLIKTHHQNMTKINGASKPDTFFNLIPTIFEVGSDYKIYMACHENKPIAAVLLFYFNNTVEYFTPVIVEEFRGLQPLSLLIFEAMKDATRAGFTSWNWGGTWLSQQGVYDFKKRWGTMDYPYYYYTYVSDKKILNYTKDDLLSAYPYFYVAPFDALCND